MTTSSVKNDQKKVAVEESKVAETKNKPKRRPDFNVFATVPNGKSSRIGAQIGCIFNHNKGTGGTILLDAVPIPDEGQIELKFYTPKMQ